MISGKGKNCEVYMKDIMAKNINILGKFCGKRDVSELSQNALKDKYGLDQVDIMVLFGGSILIGGDVLAEAMRKGIAKKYVIVGGAGHTTETLLTKMRVELPQIEIDGLSEAEIFESYLKHKYNLKPDLLECNSTNCGNNITYLLNLLRDNNLSFKNIIISQDSTMQLRMEAGLRKYIAKGVTIINYAVYDVEVTVHEDELVFKKDILGMWDMERYITLLMGEIPRLSDDVDGYGPKGRNYISHIDVPDEVRNAFTELKKDYESFIREAF